MERKAEKGEKAEKAENAEKAEKEEKEERKDEFVYHRSIIVSRYGEDLFPTKPPSQFYGGRKTAGTVEEGRKGGFLVDLLFRSFRRFSAVTRPLSRYPPFVGPTLTLNTNLFLAQPETDGCEQCEHGSHQPKGGPKGGTERCHVHDLMAEEENDLVVVRRKDVVIRRDMVGSGVGGAGGWWMGGDGRWRMSDGGMVSFPRMQEIGPGKSEVRYRVTTWERVYYLSASLLVYHVMLSICPRRDHIAADPPSRDAGMSHRVCPVLPCLCAASGDSLTPSLGG
jgi:hypothetical protein